jgi:hypothetical protein
VRRILGPKREEVAGDWRRLHKKELHNLYASPNVIRLIKSRRMRRPGHVARTRQMRNAHRILFGKPEGKKNSEDVSIDGRIILEWILRN